MCEKDECVLCFIKYPAVALEQGTEAPVEQSTHSRVSIVHNVGTRQCINSPDITI